MSVGTCIVPPPLLDFGYHHPSHARNNIAPLRSLRSGRDADAPGGGGGLCPVCGDNKGAGGDGSNSIIHVVWFGETCKGRRICRLGEPGSWLKGAYLSIDCCGRCGTVVRCGHCGTVVIVVPWYYYSTICGTWYSLISHIYHIPIE
jgi:hypothetical protein